MLTAFARCSRCSILPVSKTPVGGGSLKGEALIHLLSQQNHQTFVYTLSPYLGSKINCLFSQWLNLSTHRLRSKWMKRLSLSSLTLRHDGADTGILWRICFLVNGASHHLIRLQSWCVTHVSNTKSVTSFS